MEETSHKTRFSTKTEFVHNPFASTSKRTYNLRYNMTKAARSVVPVDTGNLRDNGVYSMKTPKGFRIVWDKRYAFYVGIVNEARYLKVSPKILANKGFVDRGIMAALMVLRMSQGHRSGTSDSRFFRGVGKANLRRMLPLFGASNDRAYNRLLKSIDKSDQPFPNWGENYQRDDITEYDEGE